MREREVEEGERVGEGQGKGMRERMTYHGHVLTQCL